MYRYNIPVDDVILERRKKEPIRSNKTLGIENSAIAALCEETNHAVELLSSKQNSVVINILWMEGTRVKRNRIT